MPNISPEMVLPLTLSQACLLFIINMKEHQLASIAVCAFICVSKKTAIKKKKQTIWTHIVPPYWCGCSYQGSLTLSHRTTQSELPTLRFRSDVWSWSSTANKRWNRSMHFIVRLKWNLQSWVNVSFGYWITYFWFPCAVAHHYVGGVLHVHHLSAVGR